MKKSSKNSKTDYLELLKISFIQLRKNLGLVVPTFIALMSAFVFILLVIMQAGGFYFLFKGMILSEEAWLLLRNPYSLTYICIMGLIDIILLFTVSSYVKSMQSSLFRDVSHNISIEDANFFKKGREYFKRYFKLNMLLTAITIVPIAIAVGLYFLIFRVIAAPSFTSSWYFGAVIFSIIAIAVLAYLIWLGYCLLFIDPIVVSTKLDAIKTLKHALKYSLVNRKKVIMTWLFLIIVMIIMITFSSIFFDMPTDYLEKNKILVFSLISFVLQGLKTLVEVIVGIVLELFRFNSFFNKKN